MIAFVMLTCAGSDRSVASQICEGLAQAIGKLGPAFIEPCKSFDELPQSLLRPGLTPDTTSYPDLNEVCTFTLQILERKALCQQDPDQEDEDELEDGEQAEYESVLISSAMDVLGALAGALGPDFSKPFESFMGPTFKYYVSSSRL